MSTSLEPQTKSGLVLPSPRDPAPPVTLELSMTSDQPHVLKATDESVLKYFPQREISAARTFPQREIFATRIFSPACGRNAQRISTDEHLKFVSSENGNSVGCERTISELMPSEKTVKSEANHAGEKHKLAVGKSISPLNEKKHKTENLGGLTTKNRVPPKGKVVYLDPAQLVTRHTDDNGCKTIVSHDRVIEALNLFRNFLKEERKKSKERGSSTNWINMLAYERLKKTHMWVNPGIAILGSIPGFEVGDKFQYRVELSIVGLHRPFESGIDYLKKGGKIIATSIVASGGYDNDSSSPDVLVYSGQGSKPNKGDKRPKDQKLEGGNLALKNSIDEKNVVRVIFGSKELQDFDSIYARGKKVSYFVYNGIYMVEKYWPETGESGTSIFKFQLRRVSGS
ncbi:YDG domain-containing protein At5g47150-like [Telopea speciosissima]|uniref:YDG domain-containing protein At5g47150-like n=1 Tax=Telopea speciosissima TaxID=54955 RepID=UPI001CC35F2F|nr:YDG domain-containing protein At5g47150-like [Telopea speciosissima]